MTLLKHVIKVWQLYCMAVSSESFWQFYHFIMRFFVNFLTVTMPYRWKNFPVKIIWDFFDNFTVWLWTFLTIVLYGCEPINSSQKSLTIVPHCFLTIVLYGFLTIVLWLLFDNFPVPQLELKTNFKAVSKTVKILQIGQLELKLWKIRQITVVKVNSISKVWNQKF